MSEILHPDMLRNAKERELYKWIDDVIWDDWDPIGVNDIPEARDEYYSYLPKILNLVQTKCDKFEIAKYLNMIEVENMGLSGNYKHCLLVAEKILNFNFG